MLDAIAVFGQAFHRAVLFHAVSLNEDIERGVGLCLRLGHPDVFQMCLGLGRERLGRGVHAIGGLVNPAPPNAGLPKTSCRADQNPNPPSPTFSYSSHAHGFDQIVQLTRGNALHIGRVWEGMGFPPGP